VTQLTWPNLDASTLSAYYDLRHHLVVVEAQKKNQAGFHLSLDLVHGPRWATCLVVAPNTWFCEGPSMKLLGVSKGQLCLANPVNPHKYHLHIQLAPLLAHFSDLDSVPMSIIRFAEGSMNVEDWAQVTRSLKCKRKRETLEK